MASWRDTQLRNANTTDPVIKQEYCLLDFLRELENPIIFWDAPRSNLTAMISRDHAVTDDIRSANTLVLFNTLNDLSITEIIDTLKRYLDFSNIKNFYVGINRYAITIDKVDDSLPDKIEDAIDVIMSRCDENFERIATFEEVTGAFFVFAHPMDLYKLCR